MVECANILQGTWGTFRSGAKSDLQLSKCYVIPLSFYIMEHFSTNTNTWHVTIWEVEKSETKFLTQMLSHPMLIHLILECVTVQVLKLFQWKVMCGWRYEGAYTIWIGGRSIPCVSAWSKSLFWRLYWTWGFVMTGELRLGLGLDNDFYLCLFLLI